MKSDALEELIALSRWIGAPEQDCAILAEGNASARADHETFWVKASGKSLAAADARSFVRLNTRRALDLLDFNEIGDSALASELLATRVEPNGDLRPSVEASMHAILLTLPGVAFVGHCHPTAINSITCSRVFQDALAGRLFPDEIVVCGPRPLLVPYVDPGLPLARELRRRLDAHMREHGAAPKSIYLQNHGFVALGASATEIRAICEMANKAARILIGAFALGGPHFMSEADVLRIDRRPDEHHRQKILRQGG